MHTELAGIFQHNDLVVSEILEGTKTQRSLLARGNWMLSSMTTVVTAWIPSKIEEIVGAVTALW